MGKSTGDEHARLYMRGVNEGYRGEILDAQNLLDLLVVFGEDGLRTYVVGVREGEEEGAQEAAAADPDAEAVFVDYETGEVTPIERGDEDGDDPLDEPDSGGDQDPK